MSDKKGWDWDIGQWFTPPKSKTPWTAMTAGAGNKNSQLERWGPAINSIGAYVGGPVYGTIGGTIGGGIGMQGRDTGFQGSDYGWGNVMPMISGMSQGSQAGTPKGMFSNAMSTGGSYWDNGKSPIGGYNTDYDRSKDPKGKQFDTSAMAKTIGSMLGSYYGGQYGGGVGKGIGGMIGGNAGSGLGNNNASSSGMDFSSLLSSMFGNKTSTTPKSEPKLEEYQKELFYQWLLENMLSENQQIQPQTQLQIPPQMQSMPQMVQPLFSFKG